MTNEHHGASQTQTLQMRFAARTDEAPLREFRRQDSRTERSADARSRQNVGGAERLVSAGAGSILAVLGLSRRGLSGLAIAGLGGALLHRGTTGRCRVYHALGVNTADEPHRREARRLADRGLHFTESLLINKPPETLYRFWRNFENLPQFMSHLESVRQTDDSHSHWVASAPRLYGGKVEWDAEILDDAPNERIAWQSLPGSDIQHKGEIKFTPALGSRGTTVRVDLAYLPPAGQVGRWTAKFFGEEPERQIHDDLRNFKRLMEVGEIPTITGQPRGTCSGHGTREQ